MSISVLFVGVNDRLRQTLIAKIKNIKEHRCDDLAQVKELIQKKDELQFSFIFAGLGIQGMPLEELGQLVRMCFPKANLYFVGDTVDGFDRVKMKKNGFLEAFLMPADAAELDKALAKELSAVDPAQRAYAAVRLVDIDPGTALAFQISVYLPANDKYLAYSAAGDTLTAERLDRLKKHQMNSVYVPVDQLEAFYEYSANRLKHLAKDGAMSETERREKLRSSVRDLVTGMLSESFSNNISSGLKVASHTKKIVSEYILSTKPGDWYTRIMDQVGQQGDTYSHTENVATYAALFGLAAGVGKSEDIAVAAMFHDLGIAMLPASLQDKRVDDMTPDDILLYKLHPAHSVELLQSRKIVVPEIVTKIILQHHEAWGGTGFPNKLEGRRMIPEAQILAVADRFDYLTRAEKNRAQLSATDAIKKIESEKIANPEIMAALVGLFPA